MFLSLEEQEILAHPCCCSLNASIFDGVDRCNERELAPYWRRYWEDLIEQRRWAQCDVQQFVSASPIARVTAPQSH